MNRYHFCYNSLHISQWRHIIFCSHIGSNQLFYLKSLRIIIVSFLVKHLFNALKDISFSTKFTVGYHHHHRFPVYLRIVSLNHYHFITWVLVQLLTVTCFLVDFFLYLMTLLNTTGRNCHPPPDIMILFFCLCDGSHHHSYIPHLPSKLVYIHFHINPLVFQVVHLVVPYPLQLSWHFESLFLNPGLVFLPFPILGLWYMSLILYHSVGTTSLWPVCWLMESVAHRVNIFYFTYSSRWFGFWPSRVC